MKIYFDLNYWQRIFRSCTPHEFKSHIVSKNFEIYFGFETIYEFGRLFLNKKAKAKEEIKEIFSYLWEMSDILKYLICICKRREGDKLHK